MSNPNTNRLDRVLFAAWPCMAFILPALVCWGFGDVERYFLIEASWIVIPVAGLLALIPYFIARVRGWRVVPGNSIGLLTLSWWSWFTVSCAIPGKLTGGGSASVLELLTGETMSRAWNERILIAAIIVGCASWVTMLLTISISGAARAPSRRQVRVGLAVALGAPCVALVAAMLGGIIENAQLDAAGERPKIASARPVTEQLELLAEREEATQASLSKVRKMIASEGWTAVHPWMFGSCKTEANPCYDIYAAAQLKHTDVDRSVLTRLADELRSAGWRSTKQPEYCHGKDVVSYRNDEGQRLCVEHRDETLSVALISPSYWGNLFALRDAANEDALIFNPNARPQSTTYRWNEWQASDLSLR